MKSLKNTLIGLTIILPIISNASPNKKVDKLAASFMQDNDVQGVSIAVIDKGKTYIFNYGYANEKTKTLVTNDTIYRIASFSKTYTATLAAVASVEGKLNLNSPIANYLPELKDNKNIGTVSTSMLLGHVSSLPFNFSPKPKTYSEAMKDLNSYIPVNSPGTEYSYSNAGIGTAGYIVQKVYNSDYDQILAQKITNPLGMTSTYLHLPPDKEKNVALGHDASGTTVAYDRNVDVWYAASSLKSSIRDMSKYMNAQINSSSLNEDVLSKAIAITHNNKYCFTSKMACEQLGWQSHVISELNNSNGDTFSSIDKAGNVTFAQQRILDNSVFLHSKSFIDKTCGGYGMSGYMSFIPEDKVGVVILINKQVGDQRVKLGRDILKIYDPKYSTKN